jgi:hypothetical protein
MCNGLPATGARVTSGAEPIGVERPRRFDLYCNLQAPLGT